MTLSEIIDQFRAGAKIRRESWREDTYICQPSTINGAENIVATDWEIVVDSVAAKAEDGLSHEQMRDGANNPT